MRTKRRHPLIGLGVLLVLTGAGRAQQPINEGLDGSWLNPETPGQGILVDVDDATSFIFLAWFTYTASASESDGVESHGWYTAQGNYEGDSADLPLSLTTGGLFDAVAQPGTETVGSLVIRFTSCTTAEVTYAFDTDERSGSFPLERLSPDVLCETLTPAPKSVSITYLGNDGVFISDEDAGVLIDALGNFSGWIPAPPSLTSAVQNADAPYDKTLLIAATHNHGDHLISSQVNSFLASQPDARVLVPPQPRGAFSTDRAINVGPSRFQSATTTAGQVTVTVINTRHFNQFGNDFSAIDNYAYLVDFSGRRILHCGDIDYAQDNFQAIIDAIGDPPDVIILPTFNTLISAANRDLVNQFFPGAQVVAAHFRSGSLAQERSSVLSQFPNAVIFDQALKVLDID